MIIYICCLMKAGVMVSKICVKDFCTGCSACANICKHLAITMKIDDKGFLYPEIDENKCIGCKLCYQICPHNVKVARYNSLAVYAAYNKNLRQRKNSSSGGVFPLMAKYIIDNGGVVFGAIWTEEFSVKHICIKNIDEIYKFSGSKYVQSYVGTVFLEVRRYLKENKKVLFSGTPCQIAGLKAFLGNKADDGNLVTVDLICHGVPPYKLFKQYLRELEPTEKIKSINLRYKKPGWSYSSVQILYENKEYLCPSVNDPYFCLFNFNYSLRDVCHKFEYASSERCGDITLSDFWGYSPQKLKMYAYDNGISSILINSKKGFWLFDNIKNDLNYEQRNINDVKLGNKCLEKPFEAPNNVEEFWNDFLMGRHNISLLADKYVTKRYEQPKYYRLKLIERKSRLFVKKSLNFLKGKKR